MPAIETEIRSCRKLFSSNSTTTGTTITGPIPTATRPTGDGIYDPACTGNRVTNQVGLMFFGTTTANQTLVAQVTGWQQTGIESTRLWVPVPLLFLTVTLGAAAGVGSLEVNSSQLFADTIVATTAFTAAYELISPTTDTVAIVKLDFFGCDLIQVQLARNSSSASMNCLARGF